MSKSNILIARIVFWVGVPVILLLLPKDFFDEGPPLCPSMLLLGEECPGCGMTRACMHLIHFDFAEAYYYNAASFVVFPVLAFAWAKLFRADWQKLRQLQTRNQ